MADGEPMSYSELQRAAHARSRLGLGGAPASGPDTAEEVVAQLLDLSDPPPSPPAIEAPATVEDGRDGELIRTGVLWWLEQMIGSTRQLEERLVWFWHDHFATSVRKVQFPYLMWTQHLTLREHATGSFAELLHAITTDPAMLIYLDGRSNTVTNINENYGREVMELFTMGRGAYTEDDVVAASRAFTGWKISFPERSRLQAEPWESVFVSFLHDQGNKTLLGSTGALDAADAIDIILDHPATAETVAGKLFAQFVGWMPDVVTKQQLGMVFRRDWSVMAVVEAIASHPDFLSDDAINARIRTPLEKALGILRGYSTHERAAAVTHRALERLGYQPWAPPNVGGFPSGPRLLGPYQMIHNFDLAGAIDPRSLADLKPEDSLARLGIHDAAEATFAVLAGAPDGRIRAALAINSPEFNLT